MSYRFSLIIPAHNEENYLFRLLETVEKARDRYAGGAGAIEVLVVDNDSTDATAEVAERWGCRVVCERNRVIAAARNRGARSARGEVLAFVDADSRIHPETFNAIDRALATGKVVAGATGVKLERMSIGIAITYAVIVPLVWITKMDTGVVFCLKEDFLTVGGYNDKRLFGEDVQFLWNLKRLGQTRGQKLTRIRSFKAITSTRKFDKHGDWHYLSMLARGPFWMIFSRYRLKEVAQDYWYDDER